MNWYKRQLKIAYPAKKFTDEDLIKIKDMVEKGIPFTYISGLYGVSQQTINRLNDKNKWRDFEKEREDRDKKILDLYLLPPKGEGLNSAEITRQTGITLTTIKNTLKRLGLVDKIRSIAEENKRRWLDPEERKRQSERTKRYHENNPDRGIEHGEMLKQRYIDNPELRDQVSERRKQFFKDNPEAGKQISERQQQFHKDHPEVGKEHSRRMIEWWKQFEGEDGEKFKNRLLSYDTRQKAINNLMGFAAKFHKEDPRKTSAIYNKFIQFINNHTYPDEVQQPLPV